MFTKAALFAGLALVFSLAACSTSDETMAPSASGRTAETAEKGDGDFYADLAEDIGMISLWTEMTMEVDLAGGTGITTVPGWPENLTISVSLLPDAPRPSEMVTITCAVPAYVPNVIDNCLPIGWWGLPEVAGVSVYLGVSHAPWQDPIEYNDQFWVYVLDYAVIDDQRMYFADGPKKFTHKGSPMRYLSRGGLVTEDGKYVIVDPGKQGEG